MSKRLLPFLLRCTLAAPAWSQAEPAAAVEAAAPSEEQILVVGQRPGPGLWKISKGEHVLWIFGTYSPLPKKMEWRSQEVEAILAQTQEVLLAPAAQAKIGFLTKLSLIPQAIGFQKIPDDGQLKDLVPADVYARWLPLRAKYLKDSDSHERDRPVFVAAELYSAALYQAGLGNDKDVVDAIMKIVKKNKIKVTATEIDLKLDDPRAMLKEFKKSPLDDAACFAKTLDTLETDIDAMRVRANAWAKGDIEAIQKLDFAERENACRAVLKNSSVIKGRAAFDAIEERMTDLWLAAVDKSLAANRSTFTIMPLRRLLEPKGILTALEARGYTVHKPE